jgi:hypothetical protein
MEFNTPKFATSIRKIHLTTIQERQAYNSIPGGKARIRLDAFIDYDNNPRISAALDEICNNIVGNTIFRVLMSKMVVNNILNNRGKLMIVEQTRKRQGSGFSHDEFEVRINLSRYEINGIGIASRQYYYIKEDGTLGTKLKSLSGSLFHEFCHGLHHVSGTTAQPSVICPKGSGMRKIWNTDEELHTITCFNHDPICDHCFDLCQSIRKNVPFNPRYSHQGWPSTEEAELLKCIPESKKFMDGWKEYMVV